MTQKSSQSPASALDSLTLGKAVSYDQSYSPQLLQAVPRSMNRQEIGLTDALPFHGEDIWHGYELSWLNSKGKPQVAILQCRIPCHSPNLVESKSFKLYLNSFNQTRVDSLQHLQQMLEQDLSQCAGESVTVNLRTPSQFSEYTLGELAGEVIDELDIEVNEYNLNSDLLQADASETVSETLVSHLLKSNCLITDQPDWGTVLIRYQGPKIECESLLRYLISFRQHNEFHEQCVERIFCDLKKHCQPAKLSVLACYTRRGGLDINPFRSDYESCPAFPRLARQ